MDIKDTRGSSADARPSDTTWWSSDFMEKFGSISLDPKAGTSSTGEVNNYSEIEKTPSQTASEVLWSTGMLSEVIPNGFYSVVPDKRLKEMFLNIPTPDEIYALGAEGSTTDIILVDTEKDKKLSMLRQLIVTLVRGLKSNPLVMIKKIAGLVSDFYKRPSSELSPGKAVFEDASHTLASRGIQMLGQIKQASCRPRAILFKVLADAVGLESRLMVGLPDEGTLGGVDSHKHLSVVVVLHSVEHLVDLMRSPGQLIPFSTKAVHMAHTAAVGESDSAENDSCDSPLEPNSPMYGFSERVEPDRSGSTTNNEKDEGPHHQRRLEASLNVAGPSLRNMMLRSTSIDRSLSLSHSDPNIANALWRRSRRKAIAEQRAASSRSEGASTSEVRRIRRRSISITPEIGDDIARAVRAMNETMKQNRLSREHGDDRSFLHSSEHQTNVSGVDHHGREEVSGGRSALFANLRGQLNPQRAVSLPSSPNETRDGASKRGLTLHFKDSEEAASTWNRVLESPMFQNMPLLPFQEWNIEYKELSVGTRVGIGFFGEVFRGVWNGTDVAIKVFLEQDLTAENMKDFCNEISILGRIRHPNVILFLGACTRPPHLSMVTEYMEMGSLYYLMHLSGQKNKLSWRRRLKMLRDICRGLMCIHRMKIVHRDIKSANCLVNKHWIVKICDFGLSRIMADAVLSDNSSAGTPEWMAPELIRNEPFSEKCDIFSFGVIMWELCTLSRPWEGVPPERVVYAVGNEGLRLEIPEGPLGSLIADCWAEPPQQRPTCQQILARLLDCEYAVC